MSTWRQKVRHSVIRTENQTQCHLSRAILYLSFFRFIWYSNAICRSYRSAIILSLQSSIVKAKPCKTYSTLSGHISSLAGTILFNIRIMFSKWPQLSPLKGQKRLWLMAKLKAIVRIRFIIPCDFVCFYSATNFNWFDLEVKAYSSADTRSVSDQFLRLKGQMLYVQEFDAMLYLASPVYA